VTALLPALGLGLVSGLRTFTPVAAVMLVRGGIWGIVLAVAAVGEYVVDVLPNTPSRTSHFAADALQSRHHRQGQNVGGVMIWLASFQGLIGRL
jgi:uncharacterized membrane protein